MPQGHVAHGIAVEPDLGWCIRLERKELPEPRILKCHTSELNSVLFENYNLFSVIL